MGDKVHVRYTRYYSAHHALLRGASDALFRVKEMNGTFEDVLTSMALSSLAVEAIANAVGLKVIEDWEDYEACNPTMKIRTICSALELPYDAGREPWSSLRALSKFRNVIAHSKPEDIDEVHVENAQEFDVRLAIQPKPESKIEKQINVQAAEKSLRAVEAFLELIQEKADSHVQHALVESWTTMVLKRERVGG